MLAYVTREVLTDLVNDIVTYENGATPTTRDIVRYVVARDIEAGADMALFAFGEDDGTNVTWAVCKRALTSRDCPFGHKWLAPLFSGGLDGTDLPFLPFMVFDHDSVSGMDELAEAVRRDVQRHETLAFVEASAV